MEKFNELLRLEKPDEAIGAAVGRAVTAKLMYAWYLFAEKYLADEMERLRTATMLQSRLNRALEGWLSFKSVVAKIGAFAVENPPTVEEDRISKEIGDWFENEAPPYPWGAITVGLQAWERFTGCDGTTRQKQLAELAVSLQASVSLMCETSPHIDAAMCKILRDLFPEYL